MAFYYKDLNLGTSLFMGVRMKQHMSPSRPPLSQATATPPEDRADSIYGFGGSSPLLSEPVFKYKGQKMWLKHSAVQMSTLLQKYISLAIKIWSCTLSYDGCDGSDVMNYDDGDVEDNEYLSDDEGNNISGIWRHMVLYLILYEVLE